MNPTRRKTRLWSTELLLVTAVVLGGLTSSCILGGSEECEMNPDEPLRIDDGTYTAFESDQGDISRQLRDRNLAEATITVNREQKEVLLKYKDGGESVVETWQIKSSTIGRD